MRVNANMYVCSKPLQYFNVSNLPRNADNKTILVIENNFKDAYLFYERLTVYNHSWDEIIFVKNRFELLLLCVFKYKINDIYYYADFLVRTALLLYVLPCKHLFVYEEGISAYRTDIVKNRAKYKRKIRALLGIPEFPGFHPKTKGIYVYCKEKYLQTFSPYRDKKKLKPLPFKAPFQKMIEDNVDLAVKIFQFDSDHIFTGISGKKVLLYLTSWPLNETALNSINIREYDYYIVKPHPHIKDVPEHLKKNKIIIVESVILAEFLIKLLIDKNNQVDIYHHNSSAVMYLNEYPNIGSVINLKNKL